MTEALGVVTRKETDATGSRKETLREPMSMDSTPPQLIGFRGGNDGAIDRGTTNNSTSNSNVEQNNNINVYSSDPKAAGKAVADVQSNNLRETRQYFSRGGI